MVEAWARLQEGRDTLTLLPPTPRMEIELLGILTLLVGAGEGVGKGMKSRGGIGSEREQCPELECDKMC